MALDVHFGTRPRKNYLTILNYMYSYATFGFKTNK